MDKQWAAGIEWDMVRRLGELLLERGAISVGELHTALEACHWSSGRLGTHLLRFGFLDEDELLEALSEQFRTPAVSESVLLQAPRSVRSLIPGDMQRRALAVPFERRPDTLAVAMVNPRDLEVREEIERLANLKVRPYVASEVAILKVLDVTRAEEEEPASRRTRESLAERVDDGEWEKLWYPPRLGVHEMRRVRPTTARALADPALAAFPELTPLVRMGGRGKEEPLNEAAYRAGLQRVVNRDDIGRLLLRYACGHLGRACLLSVHRECARGWMASGAGMVVDDIQTLEIPLDRPCVLLNLTRSGGYHLGPLPASTGNRLLLEVFGEPTPGDVLVIPVRVQGRAITFLVGDNPGGEIGAVVVQELIDAARRAGVAFEILILRKKI